MQAEFHGNSCLDLVVMRYWSTHGETALSIFIALKAFKLCAATSPSAAESNELESNREEHWAHFREVDSHAESAESSLVPSCTPWHRTFGS